MGSASGDLVTVLSLDDFEYMTGMREARGETKGLAEETNLLGEKMERAFERPIHKLTHLAGAMAFMSGSGKDIDDMGHKLERVAMVAPMIGSAFGPVGTGIGIVVGIIGAALVPKLEEAKKLAEEFGKELEESGRKFDKYVGDFRNSNKFERHLGEIDAGTDPEKIAAEKKAAEDEKSDLEFELQQRKDQFRKQVEAARDQGGVAGVGVGAGMNDFQINHAVIDEEKVGKEGYKAIKEQQEKIEELEGAIGRAENRAAALGDKLDDAREFDEMRKEEQELAKEEQELAKEEQKRLDLAEKIRKEYETPQEKAQDRLKELTDARARDVIDDDTFAKGSDKILADLEHQQPHAPEQRNAGVSGDRAYSAIRDSIRSQENKEDNPQVAALREQIEIQKKQLAATEEIGKSMPVEVELP